jgi:hypothetical protein
MNGGTDIPRNDVQKVDPVAYSRGSVKDWTEDSTFSGLRSVISCQKAVLAETLWTLVAKDHHRV